MIRTAYVALAWLAIPLTLCWTVSPAAADEPKLEGVDPARKPKGYKPGVSERFAVWHDGGVWHVRTTTGPKDRATFSGTIEVVGGKMVSLTPLSVDKGEKNKKNLDYGSWNPTETVFTFSFVTGKAGQDGFDRKVSDKATALKFALKVDGKEAPGKIFVGAQAAHPKMAAFSLPAHPGK